MIKRKYFFIFLVFLIALGIRYFLILIRKYPYPDEAWTLLLTETSYRNIWLGTLSEFHAPFYFMLLKTLRILLPIDFNIFTLRIFSLLLGIIASFSIWYLTKLVMGKKEGVIAFCLSLFLPSFIWPSIFARYYSFLILLTTLAIILFIHYLKNGKVKYLIFLAVVSTIGIYTHYYFFLLVLSFLAFSIATKKYRVFVKRILLLLMLLVFLITPALFYFFSLPKPEAIGLENNFLKIPAIALTNLTSWEMLLYLYYFNDFIIYFPVLTMLFLTSISLVIFGLRQWSNRLRNLFIALILLPPSLEVLASYTIRPLLHLGSLQVFLPPLIVILSYGVTQEYKKTKLLTIAFLLAIFFSLIFLFQSSFTYSVPTEDFRFFLNEFKKGDLVLHSHTYSFLTVKNLVKDDVNFGVIHAIRATPQIEKALGYNIIPLENVFKYKGRVWYFDPGFANNSEAQTIKTQLDANLTLLMSKTFPKRYKKYQLTFYNVYLYKTRE